MLGGPQGTLPHNGPSMPKAEWCSNCHRAARLQRGQAAHPGLQGESSSPVAALSWKSRAVRTLRCLSAGCPGQVWGTAVASLLDHLPAFQECLAALGVDLTLVKDCL